MSTIRLVNQTPPSTPASGKATLSVNSTTKILQVTDDAGFKRSLGLVNFSTAQQSFAATTRTYITGSKITVAAGALQIGTMFRWMFDITKTSAGSATSTFDICFGTAGTTADTARVSFTKPAGTAAADTGMVTITAVVRGPLSGSGVVVGHFNLTHNLQTTGHANVPCVDITTISSGFDVTTPTNIGVCLTSGASDVITTELVQAEAWNL